MGPEDTHRLAALHEQGLLVAKPLQGLDDFLEGCPVPGRLAAPAINHEVLGALGDRGIEVVVQHPEGRFLVPSTAGERCATGAVSTRPGSSVVMRVTPSG